ncbi:endonuclease domain-containing protein [Roseibium sp. Sym1]|uniref:endonuclease domain-containing protein n=1 Tax=Roseibium sp. Sym1 TaxID=3016006 RepID=UPI003FA744C3
MSPTGITAKTRRSAQRLRREQTRGEKALWRALRELKAGGIRVRRQAPIGPYVADFAVFSRKLVIEIDGDVHSFPAQQRHDASRDAWLMKEGLIPGDRS